MKNCGFFAPELKKIMCKQNNYSIIFLFLQ